MTRRPRNIDVFCLIGLLAVTLASCNANAGGVGNTRADGYRVTPATLSTAASSDDDEISRDIIAHPENMFRILNGQPLGSTAWKEAECVPGQPRLVIVNGEKLALPPDSPEDCHSSREGAAPVPATTMGHLRSSVSSP